MRMQTLVGLAFLLISLHVFGKCASQEYKVSGKVSDVSGKPIAGAKVKLDWVSEVDRGSAHFRTDARGRFRGAIWYYPWEAKPAIADWCNGKLREVTVSAAAPHFQPSQAVVKVEGPDIAIEVALELLRHQGAPP
jgi:hypothetical protein